MSKKKSHYGKAGLVFEELEPRLLLSADPLAVAMDAGAAIVQEHQPETAEDHTPMIRTGIDQPLSAVRHELVIIDSRAPNFQQLHNDLIQAQQQGRQIHVVVLDAHRDGIEQINTALESFNQLDAVHIVSHGDNGRLLLGSTQFDSTTLREHAQTINQWTNRFSDNGDLLIYGCKLAETAEGRSLATMLGHLTGTDVAASDDLTGHQILGGDWELEYHAGDIETPVAFSDDVQQTWQGTLQAPAPAGAEQQQAATNQQQQAEIEAEAAEQQAASTQTDQAVSAQYREEEQPADAEEQRREVVFIDWTVDDFGTFVDYLKNEADDSTRFDVVLLDTERNGIEQIEEDLSAYHDVDAVHIITHGGDGAIKLGNAWLNTDNIDQYSDSLMAWAGAFDQHADILFYGCDVADSAGGEHFIDRVAQLTGADVAASDDLTGHDSLGGDWDLEYHAGSVETGLAIDATTQAAYRDTLSTFVVSNTNATGAGSLHQAILDANANTGVVDTISFNIAGAGPHIINLSGPLPVIDEAVIIDGTAEPDFSYAGDSSPRPVVVIDGSSAGAVDGLVIGPSGGGSTIRGLVIQNFQNDGILLLGGNNTITANILGLQADGVTIAGNNLAGAGIHGNIRIESSNNIIGGLTPAERNIISGSGFSGIALFGAGATGNQILGNFIGTDITGTLDRGNAQEGIEIQDAGGNIIGGTVAGARNIISANGSDGMEIDNGDNNTIQGNFIGTDITGTLALGNVRDGIDINENSGAGATGNLIGGTDPNAANRIAHNGLHGVEVRDAPTVNNTILGNRIYGNGLIGIQLSSDGVVTPNDAGDSDGNSNNLQNFPVLTAADTNTIDTIVVDGSLNSSANDYFRLEFFASGAGDGSGYGEGETFLGHVNVATDGSGNASFSAALSATVANGAVISATATKSDASYSTFTDTSEFAATINAVANFAAAATDDPQAYSTYLTSLGPSGYWRLGETAGVTALDATGLNNGSYNGVTLGQAGAITADGDTALLFDGIDDYMTLAHDPAYLLDDGTVQFWFNTADVSQRADLFSKDALGSVNGGHLSIYLDGSGNIETRLQSTSADYLVQSTTALTNNQWHHVAFSFGAGGMQLYVDGQLQDSDAYTGGLSTTSGGSGNVEPIAIGASTQTSGSGSVTPLQDYYSGYMDEVALFGTALSPEQIRNLYAGGLQNYAVIEDNTLNVSAAEGVLINDYDQEGNTLTAMLFSGPSNAASFTLYNDGSFDYTPVANFNGTDSFRYMAHDGTSASNVATVTITVNADNDAPLARDDRIGLVFDGVDDYVRIGDFPGLNVSTQMTMEAWFKPTGLGSGTKIIINKEGEYEMAINATTGEVMWAFDNLDPDWNWHYTGYYAQSEAWTHIAVSYDNGLVRTYANGLLVDTYNGSGAIGDNYTGFNELQIGGRENATTQRFTGEIDEVRVWNAARTQLDIQTDMNRLLTGAEPGLIGNWRFDEGSGVAVTDQSSLGHHGTLADGVTATEMPGWNGYVVSEDNTLNVPAVNGVLTNDFDIEGDPLTAVLVSGPANAAAFTLNPDGSFSYTPTANFNGIDAFTYRANDGNVDSNIATVTIRVDPVNDVPDAITNTVTTAEDTAYNFSAGDFTFSDVEGDSLVAARLTNLSLAGGTLTYGGGITVNDGDTLTAAQLDTLDYTPAANVNGTPLATFDFTVDDAGIGVVTAQMAIDVTAVNDVPVATTNTVTVMEDTAHIFTAADFTFTDTEGDALVSATISNLSLAGGSLTHSGGISVNNGDTLSAAQLDTLVYLPAPNANGAPLALFDFSVNDTGAGTVTAQMDIDVTPVNDVPVAIANTVTTTANTAYTFNAADFTYSDVESDALLSVTFTNLSLGSGTLTYSGGITLNNGDTLSAFQLDSLVYTPPVNTTGAPLATFDFRANDAGPGVVPAQMAIDVNIANSVPVALANTVNTLEDTAYGFTAVDFTYSDAEGDALVSATITNLSLASGTLMHSGGTAVVNGDTLTVAQLDTLVYTPAANANGTPLASFDFSVNDSGLGVVSAAMSIDVSAQPDAAVIGGVDSGSVTEDVDPDMNNLLEVSGSLTISDPDAGEAAFNAGVFGGNYGVITLNATGDWHYAANTTQAAIQGLADGETLTDTINVSSVDATSHDIVITIIGTNDAPTANGIADITVDEDAAATTIDLNAAFADPDNLDAELSYAIVGNSQIGLFTSTGIDAATGRLTLDYAADMNGAAQISIRATDPAGQSVDTLFTVTVNPVNDMPVLQTNTGAVTAPGALATISNGQLNATDIDNSTAELVYTLTTLPANGELRLDGVVMMLNDNFTQADINSNRLVYRSSVPAADQFGFILSDGSGGSLNENTFSILVQLAPAEDRGVRDEPPPVGSVQDEEMPQQTDDAVITKLTETTPDFGGGYEPFGSTSTPPAPASVPPPASVVRVEPVPTAEPPQPIEPVEDLEYTATAVEDFKVSTFASVQVKSMTALWNAIDQMKQEITDSAEKQSSAVEIRVAAAETTGVVLTAGVVAWILRSGALFSSLISTIPLWKGYDPLPILAYEDNQDDKEDTIDENKIPTSMEDLKKLKQVMKQKQQAENEVDVDSMFGGSTIRE
ncbi:MAG: DUF4347 domain-containing protein [Gammaproteobacteria bacterium]|nr:DUF4347 domain-containing protein [Gammaproteobacteria bacterium]